MAEIKPKDTVSIYLPIEAYRQLTEIAGVAKVSAGDIAVKIIEDWLSQFGGPED